MSNFDHVPLLAALNSANSIESQISALRVVKNNITGHELRKAEYIRGGLIPLIARILQQVQSDSSPQPLAETPEDTLWICATNIIGSVAYGGPPFVQPILHSTIPNTLLTRLSSLNTSRLALSILRCLNVVVDHLPLSSPDDWTPDRRLANWIYNTPTNLVCFTRFIEGRSSSITSQQTCDATLALICKTCVDNTHKQELVRAGVLSSLATRLASFVVREGLVIPGIDAHGVDFQERGPVPEAAPANAHLCPVLETLALLTDSSKVYASELLYHQAIHAVLPSTVDDFSPSDIRKSPLGSNYFSGAAVPRLRVQTPLDLLLPHVPDPDKEDTSDNFPPLGSNAFAPKRRSSSIRPVPEIPASSIHEENSETIEGCLLVPWLLHIVRTYRGTRRVLASRLLVNIFKHGLVNSARARSFKALLTPLLVQALDQKLIGEENQHLVLTKMSFVEVVPFVLAKLLVDDESLQRVAVESKAITKLAICLKATFEPPAEKSALWRPWKKIVPESGAAVDRCIGSGGPSLYERHTMSYREGLLQALAAIAPFNDHYRKEICDQGALPQIMLALEPFHSEAIVKDEGDPAVSTFGNSASTLLAACDVVRALTRSVTALRTKLVDADIGTAIVKLLFTSDPEVTIAATKVIVNLAIDFSPMKSHVSEPALIRKLCEQAHSANARLRLESIWALKHLVLKSSNKLKRDVIDELGASWIRHLIATDPYDIPPGEVIGLSEKEYPPRSTQYTGHDDVIMSEDSDDDGAVTIDAVRGTSDYTKHTIEDDLSIQEQLLDLLRNLFCGENSSEIVEYVLQEIGYQEFIKIIMDRLKSKTTVGATRKANQTATAPAGIVNATLNIVVHLAACQPKFRNMITSNSYLMKQILQFHSNSDRQIRAAVCWIAINLTYGDNPAEREACRARALEMNRAGFLAHMRRMESDSELDVRERAKTAVLLLEKLIPKEIQR